MRIEQVNKNEIQRARDSLRPSWYDGKTINYFNKVIDILEAGKYARVKLTDSSYEGATIDVERVAFTHRFASFLFFFITIIGLTTMLNKNPLIN